MIAEPIRVGGLLAAGEGSRLRPGRWTAPKPLVPVGGVPLVGHVLANFAAAGVRSLTVIFNESEQDCADWIAGRFPSLDTDVILKTTANSYESFRRVAARLPPGRSLFSTVDSWCPREDFLRFARAAAGADPEATVLAVTPLVADERPLYAGVDAAGRITTLGGQTGELVTAGIYSFPERVRELSPPGGVGRLREFLAWLLESGETLVAFSIPAVVDVDRPEDVVLAEELAAKALSTASGLPPKEEP